MRTNIGTTRKWNSHMARIILTLAWPTMLEQLMQTAVQYIDTAMVGSLGTTATAAVGATTTVNWLIGSSISALSVGFLSFIARSLGAGDEAAAKRAVSQAVLAVLTVGTIFTVLTLSLSGLVPVWMQVDEHIRHLAAQYFFILYLPMLPRTATIIFGTVLRAAGDTKTPMKIGVLVNLTNVILNFLLIYPTRTATLMGLTLTIPGAGLGVIGAAAASAVAFAVGGICITIVLWRHPGVSPKGQALTPDWQILRPCLRVALPNMLQRFGTAYGAKDRQRMKDLSSMFIPIELGLMIISGALLFVLAPALMGIFSDSSEVISLGTTVLRMVAVSEPFYGFSIIVEGMMQGVGRTRQPFVFNIIGMWMIRIVGTFICTQIMPMGLVSAWACMILHNLFLFVMFLVCYLRGTWNPLRD